MNPQQQQQPQVIPFPQAYQSAYQGQSAQYLPAFPALASKVDQYATRIPWYAWLAVGIVVTYKLLTKRSRV